jgi:hypothetical protein
MPNVVLIGSKGVGKTVLMTVLAKSFERKHEGYTLIPMTYQTSQFVALNWSKLDAGDWPDPNPVGDLRELKWELRIEGHPPCELRFVELAGHDFNALFVEHAEKLDRTFRLDVAQQQLHGNLFALAQTIWSADIIGVLVNLRDLMGEADPAKRDDTQWAIKFAMDWVRGNPSPKQLALVFTQADQYEAIRHTCGNWKEVAARYLPYVYEAHLTDDQVPIVVVSAVPKTKVVVDHDHPRRVPVNLESRGTIRLLNWIKDSATGMEERKQTAASPVVSPRKSDGDRPPAPPKGRLTAGTLMLEVARPLPSVASARGHSHVEGASQPAALRPKESGVQDGDRFARHGRPMPFNRSLVERTPLTRFMSALVIMIVSLIIVAVIARHWVYPSDRPLDSPSIKDVPGERSVQEAGAKNLQPAHYSSGAEK